jgi:hypothetical protein
VNARTAASDIDEYKWGPEDDAPLPPDSQSTELPESDFQNSSFHGSLDANSYNHPAGAAHVSDEYDELPELQDVSASEDDDENGTPVLSDIPTSDTD